jgi:SNF2 family DNA or RNA helicase
MQELADGWRGLFSDRQLEQGRGYMKGGRVKGLIASADSCMARVLGTKVYLVQISGLTGRSPVMSCSCSASGGTGSCRHMAAVLYAWEEERGIQQEESEQEVFHPFYEEEEGRDQYYRLSRITSDLILYRDVWSQGRDLLSDQRITVEQPKFFYRDFGKKDVQIGRIRGSVSNGYFRENVSIVFDRRHVLSMECACCQSYYFAPDADDVRSYIRGTDASVCPHEAMLLQVLDRYLKKYNPGDATDRTASRLLDAFGSRNYAKRVDEQMQCREDILLEPRILKAGENYQLNFRIGSDHMYVVKNLTDLTEACGSRSVMKLGKTRTIDFARESFRRQSRKFYDLIEGQVRSTQLLNQSLQEDRRYYGEELRLGKSLQLRGEVLDEFYEQALGMRIPYQEKDSAKKGLTLRLEAKKPEITLRVQPLEDENGEFVGVTVRGQVPLLLEGRRHRYFVTEGVLSRLEDPVYQSLKPLLEAGSEGSVQFHVGKKALAEFYYRILPELEANPCVTVAEDSEAIEPYLPPEAEFSFYLDAEEEKVLCRCQVSYAGEVFAVRPEQGRRQNQYRDQEQEQRVLETVRQYFPEYSEEKGQYEAEREDDSVYRILDIGVRDLSRYGEVSGTDAFRRMRIRRIPQIRVGVSVESDLMHLEISSEDMSREELLRLLDSYRKKKKYHRLQNGDFIELEQSDSLEALAAMLDRMNISVQEFVKGKMHLPLYRALYLDKMLESHEEIAADRDRRFRRLVKNFKTVKESDFEVPASLKAVMRDYQVTGYQWMRTLLQAGFGGILADDMGLGKTLQMIAVLQALREEQASVPPADDEAAKAMGTEDLSAGSAPDRTGGQSAPAGPALVVCPSSLVYNWEEEIRRFAPALSVETVSGPKEERHRQIRAIRAPGHADVYVTSYELLRRDIERYEDCRFAIQVLDEAQYIKNPQAAVSKAVKIIRSGHRFALTGTPIENRLSELWSIFDYLMPGFLYSYDVFRREFELPVAKYKDEGVTQQLKQMVAPFVLRRLKTDVLKELPDKLEEVRFARMGEKQRRLYDAQVTHMQQLLEEPSDTPGRDRILILAELTKIRQICCDPSLLVEDYRGDSAKREACMDLVQSAVDGGHRILLFSQFTSMLSLLEEDLKKAGIACFKIVGSTPKKERIRLVHAFNETAEVPVFLISLKAGGTGLNLTGADLVIHYDPWWNLAAQNQATDRAHRIGQTHRVTVYRLIAQDTIEEKIVKLQESKKDLADAVLSGQSEGIGSLTREELLDLLR